MLATLLLAGALQAGPPADTLALTLDAAVRRAEGVSPRIAAAEGLLRAPLGARSEAAWPFPDNPMLEYSRVRRDGGAVTHDRGWTVSQSLEIAGQWLYRRRAASDRVDAAGFGIDDARRTTAWEARRAYLALVIATRTAALSDSAAAFAERLGEYSRRQFEAGETNRLEWNSARLEAARARSAAERARGEEAGARAELARVLALGVDTLLVASELPSFPEVSRVVDRTWIALALARRPDLRAAEAELAGAERDLVAARLDRIPDLTLGYSNGREADTERLRGFSLGFSVPLFHRNQAGTGRAEAERAVGQAAVTATRLAVRADVLAAAERLRRAASAVRQFESAVLQAAQENVALIERALAEGEVNLTDVLVLRRTAIDTQLEYLTVLHEAIAAWFDLAAALAVDPDMLPTLITTGG